MPIRKVHKVTHLGEFIEILGEHGEVLAINIFMTNLNKKAGVGFIHSTVHNSTQIETSASVAEKIKSNDKFLLEDDRQSVPCTAE